MNPSELLTLPLVRRQNSMLVLNGDILSAIFRMLSNRDLLSLLQTCKTLLLTGVQELAGRTYSFELPARSPSLNDFYSLLHAAEHISFPALHDLTIKSGRNLTRDSGVLCLEWLLYGARHLCVLNIDANLLELQDCYIPGTIWTMKELKVLRIGGMTADKMTKQVLQELRSPLECLVVSFRALNRTCLACLLTNFRNTIREAIIQGPSFSSDCHSQEPFLNLIRLSLSQCYQAPLSVLVPMFPNIQVLKLTTNDRGLPKGLALDHIRSENIRYQKEASAPLWPSLKVLVVSKSALHLLAMQREVDSVTLAWPMVLEQEDDIAWLEKSLASLSPKHLKIQVKHNLTRLLSAISTCTYRLQRIDITIKISVNSRADILHQPLDVVAFSRVRMISISFDCVSEPETRPEHLKYLHSVLDQLDMRDMAHVFLAAGRNLEYMRFRVARTPRFPVRVSWWTVTETEHGNRRPRRVSPEDHAAIHAIEAMFLPEPIQLKADRRRLYSLDPFNLSLAF